MNERVFNQDEKIRRAEEIYYRRKNLGGRKQEQTTLNLGNKKDYKLFKKMALQIFACFLIYLAFSAIQNSNYIFSEQLINKTKEVLSYDINLEEIKNNLIEQFNKLKTPIPVTQENDKNEEEKQEDNNAEENAPEENAPEENVEEQKQDEENVNTQTSEDILYKEEASSVSQVEEDADYIKANFSFIKPLDRKNNIKIWCKESNYSNSSKVSYWNRYCGQQRNCHNCCNGGICNSSIISW